MKVIVESLIEGLMVYWDEVKKASRYYVHLLIGDRHRKEEFNPKAGRVVTTFGEETFQEIKLVECDRHTKTYSFNGLAIINKTMPKYNSSGVDRGFNYYVYVEAEDKEGSIIDSSDKTVGQVLVFCDGYYLK